jgi:predicted phage-related endonuclease
MEEPILKWFEEDFEREEGVKIELHRTPYMYASRERPWQIGDIDALMLQNGKLGGVEIKTHDRYALKAYGEDTVPDWVDAQVQHYMAVTGLPWFYVVALIGRKLLWRIVGRNEKTIKNIIAEEENFYNRYMLGDALPAPAGMDSDDDIIKALYGLSDSQDEVMLAEDSLLAQLYVEATAAEKTAAEQKARARQTIQMHMGTAKYAICGDYRATWTRFKQNRIDLDLLKQELPDVADKYSEMSIATRFSIKEVSNG